MINLHQDVITCAVVLRQSISQGSDSAADNEND